MYRSVLLLLAAILIFLFSAPIVFLTQIILLVYFKQNLQKYFLKIAISIDQLGNALLNGNEDETISGHLGVDIQRGKYGKWKWKVKFCKFLDFIFSEKNHCLKSIDKDEYIQNSNGGG